MTTARLSRRPPGRPRPTSRGGEACADGSEQPDAAPAGAEAQRAPEYASAEALRPLPLPADLVGAVEALLFVAAEPVEPETLAHALNVDAADVAAAIGALSARLAERGIRVQHDGVRIQLVSAPEFGVYVERFLGTAAEQKLSTAALETLAIVAYRQPVTRAVIESVRGVNSERALTALRVRGLVDEVGRAETVGRPVLFGTTMRFLEYFGLAHPGDLPPLSEG